MVLDAPEMEDKTLTMKASLTQTDRSNIKKILVVAPNWIGDAVLAIPAISAIREYFPHSKITLIALPHVGELFKESCFIDGIKRFFSASTHSHTKGGLMAEALKLRQDNFDLAVLFPNSFRSAMLVRLAGIPLRCGYKRDGRGFLLNIPVRLNSETRRLHHTEYYLNIIHTIQDFFIKNETPSPLPSPLRGEGWVRGGFSGENVIPEDDIPKQSLQYVQLFISKDEANHAIETLSKNNITPDDLIIGINPGAAYGSSKRWYPDRFGQVAKTLINGYNVKVIVFGSQGETSIAEDIIKSAEVSIVNLAGKTSIRELMALINYCRVLITNDSGPMHIASALSVPVVAIFGSTEPSVTGPLGARDAVIKKELPCSPCFLRKCPTNLECMDIISVDDVISGVVNILEK